MTVVIYSFRESFVFSFRVAMNPDWWPDVIPLRLFSTFNRRCPLKIPTHPFPPRHLSMFSSTGLFSVIPNSDLPLSLLLDPSLFSLPKSPPMSRIPLQCLARGSCSDWYPPFSLTTFSPDFLMHFYSHFNAADDPKQHEEFPPPPPVLTSKYTGK